VEEVSDQQFAELLARCARQVGQAEVGFGDEAEQGVLAAEVADYQRRVGAGSRRDFAHGGSLEPLFGEQLPRRLLDRGARTLGLGRLSPGHRTYVTTLVDKHKGEQ